MISGDGIVEQLRQLPNGNAVALCVSFLADTIYPGEDKDSVSKSLMFVDEVFELITKHKQEENDEQ